MSARWRERDIVRKSIERRDNGPLFVFYEGPPTANGRPGSHHVLNRVFKDAFLRYRAMRGQQVRRMAGWDCHGLPVELEVERQLDFSSKADIERYGVAEFNAQCRESVLRYIDEWRRLTERIGFWIDFDDSYHTFSTEYIESVWWSLKEVWAKGLLSEGHKVVPCCPRCGTGLSSHEVALGYRDVVDPSVVVKFPLRDEPGVAFLSWTTNPWSLLANAALAVHPDMNYVRAHVNGEALIVAEPLAERVLGEGIVPERPVRGSELVGTAYEPPFSYIRDFGPHGHTVLPADYVTTDEGTGIVHAATAFGEDDFRLGERYGIPVANPVKLDGTFDDRIEGFAGRFVKDADPDIVEALRRSGRLFRAGRHKHSYPHCWRCDTPLLYYAKKTWYVRTTEIREQLLAANDAVSWRPEHIKHGRFGKWLEGNVDWALSRERYWGTPLPIWRADDGEVVCIGSREELRDLGAEVPDDLHRPHIDEVTFERDGKVFRRVPDVIDVWWDSGCVPFAQWHAPFENQEAFREHFPADYVGEGLDQTRGWFYSLLGVSTALFGCAPYRTVLCLGLILDSEGQKMSKSRGNVVDPEEVIETHGADALRWYYMTSKQPWNGYRFSFEAVNESVRQFLKTLWSVYGFLVLYANVNDVPRDADGERTDLDRWALARLAGTVECVTERMEDYDTASAGRAVADLVEDLSNWYIRRCRRRFWDGDPAAFATLRHCLVTIAKLLAPLTPFVADEIYENLDGSEPSVHFCAFPEPTGQDERLEWAMRVARSAVELGRAARARARVRVRQPLREAVVLAADRKRVAIERFEALVREELNVKSLRYVSESEELGHFEPRPNYKVLGPRFRGQMPQVEAAIAALDPAIVRAGRTVAINIEGKEHEIRQGDVQMVLQPLEGYQVERSGTHAVALELKVDDDLRREGLARDIVQAVQAARRDASLEVEARMTLRLDGHPDLLDAVRSHEDFIAGETLAVELTYSNGSHACERVEIDGHELLISIERLDRARPLSPQRPTARAA